MAQIVKIKKFPGGTTKTYNKYDRYAPADAVLCIVPDPFPSEKKIDHIFIQGIREYLKDKDK